MYLRLLIPGVARARVRTRAGGTARDGSPRGEPAVDSPGIARRAGAWQHPWRPAGSAAAVRCGGLLASRSLVRGGRFAGRVGRSLRLVSDRSLGAAAGRVSRDRRVRQVHRPRPGRRRSSPAAGLAPPPSPVVPAADGIRASAPPADVIGLAQLGSHVPAEPPFTGSAAILFERHPIVLWSTIVMLRLIVTFLSMIRVCSI